MNNEKKENWQEEQKEKTNLEMHENITYCQSEISCDHSFAQDSITLMLAR